MTTNGLENQQKAVSRKLQVVPAEWVSLWLHDATFVLMHLCTRLTTENIEFHGEILNTESNAKNYP